ADDRRHRPRPPPGRDNRWQSIHGTAARRFGCRLVEAFIEALTFEQSRGRQHLRAGSTLSCCIGGPSRLLKTQPDLASLKFQVSTIENLAGFRRYDLSLVTCD